MENNFSKEELEEVYREIRLNPNYMKHANLKLEYTRKCQFAKAAIEDKIMKDMEKAVFDEISKGRIITSFRVKEKLAQMSEEDKHFLNISSNALRMLSDLVEVFIMDANTIMHRYGLNNIKEYDKLSATLKESRALVRMFDTLTNDGKVSSLFGDCSDNLYKLVFNKASSFVNKVKKYEESVNKKMSRQTKVA